MENSKKNIPSPPIKINPLPKDWAKKYFMADSIWDSVEEITIKGINESILISNPAQIKIHEEEEIDKMVPKTKEKQKNIV